VADIGVPRIVAGLTYDPLLRITNQAVDEYLQVRAPPPAHERDGRRPVTVRYHISTPVAPFAL
jgi:hypothetical protein